MLPAFLFSDPLTHVHVKQTHARSIPPDSIRTSLRVAVRGSAGLIGTHLVRYLRGEGHRVYRLLNDKAAVDEDEDAIYFDHRREAADTEQLEGLDGVINLSDRNVFSVRWSETVKMEISDARVRGTRFLADTLAGLDDPPEVFLSESATGYYGDRGDAILTESSSPGDSGFLMALCVEWEDAARPAAEVGIRTVPMRVGVVFTPDGGALEYLLMPFRWGLGGRIGRRNQYFPWIAIDDVLGTVHHLLLADALDGPVNVSAPHPVTAEDMVAILARVLARPAILTIPEPVTRFLFGKSVEDLLLNSARVKPERLLKSGFTFQYPEFEPALRHLLDRPDDT